MRSAPRMSRVSGRDGPCCSTVSASTTSPSTRRSPSRSGASLETYDARRPRERPGAHLRRPGDRSAAQQHVGSCRARAEDLGAAARLHRFWASRRSASWGERPTTFAACSRVSAWRAALRPRRARASATTSCASTLGARRGSLRDLRDRPAAVGPVAARPPSPPSRSCIRAWSRNRRRHRGAGRPRDCDVRDDADWLFVSYITPLVPGDEATRSRSSCDERRRAVPLSRPSVRVDGDQRHVYPLFIGFGRGSDTTVVFDDVFVPWEQVFIYRNVDLNHAQFHDSPSQHDGQLSGPRPVRREARAHGRLAMRLAEIQKAEGDPGVQATLAGTSPRSAPRSTRW